MKKLLYIGAVAILLAGVSCDGNGSRNEFDDGFDTLFSQGKTDTLISTFGLMAGTQTGMQFNRALMQDTTLSKEDFIKGVKYAFVADTTTSFMYGLQVGQQLLNSAKNYHEQGLKFNDAVMLQQFTDGFMADTVNEEAMAHNDMIYNGLEGEFQQAVREYRRLKIENGEESKANVARGREYIDSLRKTQGYTVMSNGVAYKVDSVGEGPKPKLTDRIRVRFVAKTLDGRQFEQMLGAPENLRHITVMSLPTNGLSEAITEMPVGSQATVVVPGSEAFGAERGTRYGLGPNETVIFNVEILDMQEPVENK